MTAEQQRYQVRFDWGAEGAAAVGADAALVIWVDALGEPAVPLVPGDAVVVTGLRTAAAAADYLVDVQGALGARAMVAVVAAGGDGVRFAVEDLLAAGAVIDARGERGIDATSPAAAAAQAAYTGRQGAVGHLLTACVRAGSMSGGVPADARRVDPAATRADLRVERAHPALG